MVARVRRLRHAQEVKDVEPLGDLLTDQSRFFELQNALLDRDERIRELGGEVQKLRELGCDVGQGFLFSRPIPPEKLIEWISATPVAAESLADAQEAAESNPAVQRQ